MQQPKPSLKQTPLDYLLAASQRLQRKLRIDPQLEHDPLARALGVDTIHLTAFDWLTGQFQSFATKTLNDDEEKRAVGKICRDIYKERNKFVSKSKNETDWLYYWLKDKSCSRDDIAKASLNRGRHALSLGRMIEDVCKGDIWTKGLAEWRELFCYLRLDDQTITGTVLKAMYESKGFPDRGTEGLPLDHYAFMITKTESNTLRLWPIFNNSLQEEAFCNAFFTKRRSAGLDSERHTSTRFVETVPDDFDGAQRFYGILEENLRPEIVSKDNPALLVPLYFNSFFLGFVIVELDKMLTEIDGRLDSEVADENGKLPDLDLGDVHTKNYRRVEIIQNFVKDGSLHTTISPIVADILSYQRREILHNCISNFEQLGAQLDAYKVREVLNGQLRRLPYLLERPRQDVMFGQMGSSAIHGPIRIRSELQPGEETLTREDFGFYADFYTD